MPASRQTFREPERKIGSVLRRPVSRFPEDRFVKKSVLRTVPKKTRPAVSISRAETVKSSEKVEAKPSKPAKTIEKPKQKIDVDKEKQEETKETEASEEKGPSNLDEVTKKVLDAEIDTVLDKVWEVVSTKPSSETDKVVVTSFRNEAGLQFAKAMANNVAQRLLKVHNPLLVKLTFNSRPQEDAFKSFLKKFNCTTVKRTYGKDLTFVAKMNNYTNFDKICALTNAKCGNARVLIRPVYKFAAKPVNLEYVYETQKTYADREKKTDPKVKKEKAKDEIGTIPDDKGGEIETNVKNKENKVESSKESKKSQPTEDRSEVTKINTPVKAQQLKTKVNEAQAAKTGNNANQTEINKDSNKSNDLANEKAEAEKANQTKTKSTSSDLSESPKIVQDKLKPNTIIDKVTAEKPKITETKKIDDSQKENAADEKAEKPNLNEKVAKKSDQAKNVAAKVINKPKSAQETPKKGVVSGKKPQATASQSNVQNKTVKRDSKVKSKASVKIDKELSDNDELDDYDILAMMSEAIILDECGSDED